MKEERDLLSWLICYFNRSYTLNASLKSSSVIEGLNILFSFWEVWGGCLEPRGPELPLAGIFGAGELF